jgi:hypothetical protein
LAKPRVRRPSRLSRVRSFLGWRSLFWEALGLPAAARHRAAARRPPSRRWKNGSDPTGLRALGAGARRRPEATRPQTPILAPGGGPGHATTRAAGLGSARHAPWRPAPRGARAAAPGPQSGPSPPRPGREAGPARPPGALGGVRGPFFPLVRTVWVLPGNARAGSRRPLAFMALATICCGLAGAGPGARSASRHGRPAQRGSRPRDRGWPGRVWPWRTIAVPGPWGPCRRGSIMRLRERVGRARLERRSARRAHQHL